MEIKKCERLCLICQDPSGIRGRGWVDLGKFRKSGCCNENSRQAAEYSICIIKKDQCEWRDWSFEAWVRIQYLCGVLNVTVLVL